MKEAKIIIESTDPSSRLAARQYRDQVTQYLCDNDIVTIDLGAVQSMSDSFADELFAVLSIQIGLEPFLDQIRIQNSRPSIEYTIGANIKNRNTPIIAA